jgi:hypothetical protein
MRSGRADKADVLQGTLILVLRTLEAVGPLHGYGIARRIEQISKDVLKLNIGGVRAGLAAERQALWPRLERELDDEVRFHLEMQIEDNLEAGMNPVEARHAALRSFGAIEPMKERYRERWAFALVETTAQDIRYAVRTLRKSPGFTVTSVATLALAIGASTAMFSVLNAVLLRPLPFRAPEQLAMLWTEDPAQNLGEGRSAYWNVEQWLSQSRSFADIAVFDPVSVTLTSADEAEKISVARISPNVFPLLGVQLCRGAPSRPRKPSSGSVWP